MRKDFHHLGHRGALLPDGDVDTDDAAVLLVDDRVDRDGRLADLTVADDQFALAAAHGGHGVDGLEPCVHRLVDRGSCDDARCDSLDAGEFRGRDGTLAVQGVPHGIDDAAQYRVTHGNFGDTTGTPHFAAFLDVDVFAHDGNTHVIFFEVEGQTENRTMFSRELEQFHGHALFDAVDARDTVTDRKHPTRFAELDLLFVILDLLSNNLADFFCSDFH